MLDTLESLDRQANMGETGWVPSDTILLDDWETLAVLLPNSYNAGSLNRVYRKRLDEGKASAPEDPDKTPPAGESFLSKLNDGEVRQLVECIKGAGCPAFAHLRATLNIKKTDGRALSQIMSHATDVKRDGNNKPPLCKDLEPALRDVRSSAAAAEITQMSIELEREILEYAISRPKELDRLSGSIIDELPTGDGAGSAAYASRFIDGGLWRGILEIVRRRWALVSAPNGQPGSHRAMI